jgi:hypothetical protein
MAIRRYSIIFLMSSLLILSIQSFLSSSQTSSICPTTSDVTMSSSRGIVAGTIKSLTNFELFDGGNNIKVDPKGFPQSFKVDDIFKSLENKMKIVFPLARKNEKGQTVELELHLRNLYSSNFQYWSNQKKQEITARSFSSRTYIGTVTEDFDGKTPNKDESFAVFYTPAQGFSQENFLKSQGFVSGFVMLRNEWYFFEPVRPLFHSVHGTDASVEAKLRGSFLTADCRTHIVYKASDTNFKVTLGAVNPPQKSTSVPPLVAQSQDQKNSLYDSVLASNSLRSAHTLPIAVALYGDQSCISASIDIQCWQRHMDVFNPVAAIFTRLFADRRSVLEISGSYEGNWRGYQPNESTPRALALLCNFIDHEIIQESDLNDVEKDIRRGLNSAGIIHVMTGKVLSSQLEAFDDVAFCPADSCGGNNFRIIGMAEGIGGVGNPSTADTCNVRAKPFLSGTKISGQNISLFQGKGKHSIGSYSAVITESRNNTIVVEPALLFLRVALMAHEIGHNLNAVHPFSVEPAMAPDRACNSTAVSCMPPPPELANHGATIMRETISNLTTDQFYDERPLTDAEKNNLRNNNNQKRIMECLASTSSPC